MASVPHRTPRSVQKELEQGKYGDDGSLPGNRFLELKALRPSQRAHAVKNKLIADPENRTDLTGAITVVGTCLDMCPEFERHEREYQKDVDEWEKIPGTNPKRIDHTRAVKKYRRSAAGNEDPLPSDLRPPHILKKTLDYLLEQLLPTHGLAATYAFIRDRTRAIRTDFVIQHVKGPSAIECFERIARFHILAVHAFCDGEGLVSEDKEEIRGFDYWLEVEQMMKTLQSLIQFYDDRPITDPQPPNEAEFRAYYLLAHIRSNSILRRLHTLPQHIFLSPMMQSALDFRAYAQSVSVSATNTHVAASGSTHKSRTKSLAATPPLQNFFTRFFKRIANPATSYLLACLLEYHFGGVRRGAIHALWKAYSTRHRGVPIQDVGRMLGFSNLNGVHSLEEDGKVEELVKKFGMRTELDSENADKRVVLSRLCTFDYNAQITQRHSSNLVEPKRGLSSDVELVNGNFGKAETTWKGVVQTIPTVPTSRSVTTPTAFPTPTPTPTPAPTAHPSFPSPSFRNISADFRQRNGMSAHQSSHTAPIGAFLGKPFEGTIAPAFAFKKMESVPAYIHPTSAYVSPPVPLPAQPAFSQNAPDVIPNKVEEELERRRQVVIQKEQEEKRRVEKVERDLRLQMKERRLYLLEKEKKSAEEERHRKEQEKRQRLEEESERRQEEERRRIQEEEDERRRVERERQERLKRERRERTRTADLWFLDRIFNRWKHTVVRLGEGRRAFRQSILEMGMSAGPSEERTVARSSKIMKEEDVISWEDLSEFSIPESYLSDVRRRRRSKGKKRMDDEAILTAIKEAETTRLKLWERGSFLQFVEETRCRGDVWLSTSPQNMSTGDWLRIKFDVQTASANDAVCVPRGDGGGPGLVVIDLTPSDDESVIQSDVIRLRRLFSTLPSGRHYIPSVLFIQWTGSTTLTTPILSEINTLLEKKIILDVRVLAFNNDDLNDQFRNILKEISFDTVGRLVKKMGLEDIFDVFLQIWEAKLSENLGRCQLADSIYSPHSFNWPFYGQIIEIFINLLQQLAEEMSMACRIDTISESWPKFDGSAIVDDRTAFQTFIDYLESSWLAFEEPAIFLKAELVADMDQSRKFEVHHIPSRIAYLLLYKFQTTISPDSYFYVDVHKPLPNAIAFSEAVCSALATIDENYVFRKNLKKRNASDDRYLNGGLPVKRYKQDDIPSPVKGHGDVAKGEGQPPTTEPDVLTRLRSSIMKAKQSVEDLRTLREICKENTGSVAPNPSDVELSNRVSSEDPSSLSTPQRLYDDLDFAFFKPSRSTSHLKYHTRNPGPQEDDTRFRTPQKSSISLPASVSLDDHDSIKPSASLQKLIARGSAHTNGRLADTIERAKQSIQEARKLRRNDASIK